MQKLPILVPYDFTPEADCALEHAKSLAAVTNNSVVLNHIFDKKSLSKIKGESKTIEEVTKQLSDIAALHNTEATPFDSITRTGDIFSTIPEIATEINASMICFGTHGVVGMQHVLGAFALKLVIQSTVPVVIVQRKKPMNASCKLIVFPVDESVFSKQKSYLVADFAKKHNAEIHIIPKYTSDTHFQNYTNANAKYARAVFENESLKATLIENKSSKGFSKVVLDHAATNNADLIAITTQSANDKSIQEIFVSKDDVKIINNESQIPTMCINALMNIKFGGVAGVATS